MNSSTLASNRQPVDDIFLVRVVSKNSLEIHLFPFESFDGFSIVCVFEPNPVIKAIEPVRLQLIPVQSTLSGCALWVAA